MSWPDDPNAALTFAFLIGIAAIVGAIWRAGGQVGRKDTANGNGSSVAVTLVEAFKDNTVAKRELSDEIRKQSAEMKEWNELLKENNAGVRELKGLVKDMNGNVQAQTGAIREMHQFVSIYKGVWERTGGQQ